MITQAPGAMIDQAEGHNPLGAVCAFWIKRPAAESIATTISRDNSKKDAPAGMLWKTGAVGDVAVALAAVFLAAEVGALDFGAAVLAIVSVLPC
ncbi:hypothetical protein NKJ06_20120 [Mesorhizobium sp. M0293]|uniref:hypothetical protein n=1 Tax=Mesorhizobium sp. M0293 TaxID=2956930 RepID=UPI0033358A3C